MRFKLAGRINNVAGSVKLPDGRSNPIYNKWNIMFNRCYSEKYQLEHPTYRGCYVCDEWFDFANFLDWIEKQDWIGKDLDKDFLFEGNKVYSPSTCLLLPQEINKFITIRTNDRGDTPLGVTHTRSGYKKPFRAQCNDYNGKRCTVGTFYTEMEAHKAYLGFKLEVLKLHMLNYSNDPLITRGLMRIKDKLEYHIVNNLELTSF